MGYSMAAPIRSKELRAKMLAFLKKHWRNWPTLNVMPKDPQFLSEPRGSGLSYDHGRQRIGFDFNASEGERMYGWCICAWMALRVGRKGRDGIPYFMYDGDEKIPVIVGPPKTGGEGDCHDRYSEIGVLHLGRHDLPYTYPPPGLLANLARRMVLKPIEDQKKKEREIIREEIERLDALWKEEA